MNSQQRKVPSIIRWIDGISMFRGKGGIAGMTPWGMLVNLPPPPCPAPEVIVMMSLQLLPPRLIGQAEEGSRVASLLEPFSMWSECFALCASCQGRLQGQWVLLAPGALLGTVQLRMQARGAGGT